MIVNPTSAEGWLQAQAMDSARARLVQALRRLDRHGRLAMYHPFTAGCEPIYVHAKIMVVDGASIRVGSANINKWSMGLDSECEVLVAGNDDAVRAAAAALRNGLLAEHFGTMPATVAAAITEHGLIGAVEACAATVAPCAPTRCRPRCDRQMVGRQRIAGPRRSQGDGRAAVRARARPTVIGTLGPRLIRSQEAKAVASATPEGRSGASGWQSGGSP